MKFLLFALVAAGLAGCGTQSIENAEAVRQGVLDHLTNRSDFGLNLDAMTIEVSNVTFREGEADARVSFVPKGGPADSGMAMDYKLKQENGKWVVKDKTMSGGSLQSAPGGAALPEGHAPVAEPKDGK